MTASSTDNGLKAQDLGSAVHKSGGPMMNNLTTLGSFASRGTLPPPTPNALPALRFAEQWPRAPLCTCTPTPSQATYLAPHMRRRRGPTAESDPQLCNWAADKRVPGKGASGEATLPLMPHDSGQLGNLQRLCYATKNNFYRAGRAHELKHIRPRKADSTTQTTSAHKRRDSCRQTRQYHASH